MIRKRNEMELGKMMRNYGFYVKKARDRGYISCPHCGIPVKTCPICGEDMLLNKAETLPDFLVAFDYIYVEGKSSTADDRWYWRDSITPTQEQVCLEHESWLFLEMGNGRAPIGRSAFLLPWLEWKKLQAEFEEKGFLSLIFRASAKSRSPVADEVLAAWKVQWNTGGWIIPYEHPFWKKHRALNG